MRLLHIAVLMSITASSASAQLARALELNTRGNDATDAGKYEEAIGLFRESIGIWRAAGEQYDPHRAGSLMNLGIVISAMGNRPEAARTLEESLALHRRTLGVRSHRTLSNMNLLASNYLM